ncbi:MAG: hypothetical protein NZ516_05285 [Raineya sp.]|nr:hypothetical protein [Raineya sp.]
MFLKIFFLTLGFVFLSLHFAIWLISYEKLLLWLAEAYPFDEIQWQKLTTQILKKFNFIILQIVVSSLFLVFSFLSFWLSRKYTQVQEFLSFIRTSLYQKFRNFYCTFEKITIVQKIIVVIFLFASFLFNAFWLNFKVIHIDEAFSYVHYASKGWIVSALYYPNPNNHILFNLWVSFWEGMFSNKIWAVRLPSMLCLLLLQILLLRFFLQRNSFEIALGLVAVFTLLSPVQAYSVSGRGYLLLTLCVWIVGNSFLQILEKVQKKENAVFEKIVFVLASIAGFYTIPLFVYYFLGMVFNLTPQPLQRRGGDLTSPPSPLSKGEGEDLTSTSSPLSKGEVFDLTPQPPLQRRGGAFAHIISKCKVFCLFFLLNLKMFLPLFFWIVGGVVVLYFPVFLLNGKENLFATSWQSEAQRQFEQNFWQYWQDFGDFWLGIDNSYIFFLPLLIFLVFFSLINWSRISVHTKFWLKVLVICLFVMILQQKFLPVRAWVAFAISVVFVFEAFIRLLPKFWKIFALIGALLILSASQFYQIQTYRQTYSVYLSALKEIQNLPFKPQEKVFSNDLVYQNLIAFYNLQEKWHLQVDYSFKNKNYDWIILDKNMPFNDDFKKYQKFKETAWVWILRDKTSMMKLKLLRF